MLDEALAKRLKAIGLTVTSGPKSRPRARIDQQDDTLTGILCNPKALAETQDSVTSELEARHAAGIVIDQEGKWKDGQLIEIFDKKAHRHVPVKPSKG
jgi:hypothetical protein